MAHTTITNPHRKIKTALFIAGQIRHDAAMLRRIIAMYQREMPWIQIIGACWDTCELNEEIGIPVHRFPEPVMHYKPYEANEHVYYAFSQYKKKIDNMARSPGKLPDENNRDTHQTKQMLIHNELLKKFEGEFDVVIRVRWDALLGRGLQMYRLVEEAMMCPAVVSLGCRSTFNVGLDNRVMTYDSKYCDGICGPPHIKPKDQPGMYPYRGSENEAKVWVTKHQVPMMTDYGPIIHRTHDWNTELIDRLHKDKLLLPAEWGWYQVLVEHPQNRHRHWDGGAVIFRAGDHLLDALEV
tara:strand:- start:3909 stop:4796 length:888 start_codon:yes stop_codon:yes gene_type:complete